jgi:hypothetical protein
MSIGIFLGGGDQSAAGMQLNEVVPINTITLIIIVTKHSSSMCVSSSTKDRKI